MPRLTAVQYRNTLEDLFGDDLPPTPVEADTNPYLFYNIGATTTSLSGLGAQRYAEAATAITDAIFSSATRRDALLGCAPASPGDACIESFVRTIGKRLFRRPLTSEEAVLWTSLARDLAEGDPYDGARLALYGMLQSPSFLYRVERGEPDPRDGARLRYTSFEMASRLSFLFWNTTPDDELLLAAERGDLVTDEGILEQAARLGESPRARRAVMDFFAQYLDLARLDQLERDPERYPAYSATLAASMRAELRLLVDDFVFRRDADVRGLFDTRRTFVNTELAALYGVDAPGASPIAFVPVAQAEAMEKFGPRGPNSMAT